VRGSIYTSNTLHRLKELSLNTQKAHTTALLHAHPAHYAHKLTATRCALEKTVALNVLVWSRGQLVSLQILTSSSLTPVEETKSSLGQCVSLINAGSFTASSLLFQSAQQWLIKLRGCKRCIHQGAVLECY